MSNMRSYRKKPVEWIEGSGDSDSEAFGIKVKCYRGFKFGSIKAQVGDYVLISNADAAEPDTQEGCDVAQVLKLYEAPRHEDPFRARVQWYSRAREITKKACSSIKLDLSSEVVQDTRPFDNDVSIETFFSICQVIIARADEEPKAIMRRNKTPPNVPTFVCRYKYVTSKRALKLEPLLQVEDVKTPLSKIQVSTPGRNSPRSIKVTKCDSPHTPKVRSLKLKVERCRVEDKNSVKDSQEMNKRSEVNRSSSDSWTVKQINVPRTSDTNVNECHSVKIDALEELSVVIEKLDSKKRKKELPRSRSSSPTIPLTEPSLRWIGIKDKQNDFRVVKIPIGSNRTPLKKIESENSQLSPVDSEIMLSDRKKMARNINKPKEEIVKSKRNVYVRKLKDEEISKMLEEDVEEDDDFISKMLEEDDDGNDSGNDSPPETVVENSRKSSSSSLKEKSKNKIIEKENLEKKIISSPYKKHISEKITKISEKIPSSPRLKEKLLKSQHLSEKSSPKSALKSAKKKLLYEECTSSSNNSSDAELKVGTPRSMKMKNAEKAPVQRDSKGKIENDQCSTPKRRRRIESDDEEGTPARLKRLKLNESSPQIQKNGLEASPSYKSSPRKPKPNRKYDDDWVIGTSSPKKHLDSPATPKTPSAVTKLKLQTPGSKKGSARRALLTPSVPTRTSSVSTPGSVLEEARARLHVSAVPKSLPCREREFDNIYYFLEGKIIDGAGGCMYISGVPGTGKTATVQEVVRTLQEAASQRNIPDFQFIELNGMRLTEPRQAYVQLLKQLTGQTVVAEQAQQILERRFSRPAPKRITTLLLVDELDLLWTRRQDVVYNLLDWPTKPSSRLVVLTIANTMDLPERLLMGRVTSRLGLTRVTFHPYTHKQLQEIVMARLKGLEAFDPDAVQLVARKVAAVSGDARRALDICRRATELAESDDCEGIVEMKHVDQALVEMVASTKVQAIKYCSKMEQIFLQAVAAEIQRTGVEETTFNKVFYQLRTLCTYDGFAVPSITTALGLCARLGSCRLLLTEHSSADIYQKVLLNVSSDDIHYALKVNQ